MLVHAPSDQRPVVGHAFVYDISQGGTAITDPDGDPLSYSVSRLPPGLSVAGAVISGVPTVAGPMGVDVQVSDNRGGDTIYMRFYVRVADNSSPVVVNHNLPQLVTAGGFVSYDAAQNNTTFAEPDGDAVTLAVSYRGDPQGLEVSGTRVSGTMERVGAVEFTITARDAYGGVGSDSFLIVVPAAEPGTAPNLPAKSYVYRDEELLLPFIFRISSESEMPLWDTQPPDNRTTNAGATLGRVLFYDRRLSITNTISCASCHDQSRGFASARRFDTGVLGIALPRNTMALANARYSIHRSWFADMRVQGDLRNLIFVPIDNHDELGLALFSIESKLEVVPFYPPLFEAAFGTPAVTRDRIAAALAQFVQSLISYRSKSDRAINPMENGPGQPASVFDAKEMRGMQIYQDTCETCHELRASTNVWQANNGLDAEPTDPGTLDPGLRRDGTRGIFRAASLRNVAMSGPYMHDGRFGTLREVIEHYDHGVQASPDLDHILRDFTGAPRRLNLSEADKDALEAFLNTLTDVEFLSDPKFSDPFPPQ